MKPISISAKDLVNLFRPSFLPTRTGTLMIAACIPAILCSLVMTVPGLIFSIPNDNAYFHFSRILIFDHASFVPIALTALSAALALLLPLNPQRAALAKYLSPD